MQPVPKNKVETIKKFFAPQKSEDLEEEVKKQAKEDMPEDEFWEEASKGVASEGKSALRLKRMQMKKQRGL
jgi:hypothetical protein